MNTADPVATLAVRYAEALLSSEGRPAEANGLILEALGAGMSPVEMCVDMLPSAMAEVGRRWEHGEASVADEHLATIAVQEMLRELVTRFPRMPARGRLVIVASVERELHDLGARIVGDLLEADGWEVLFVGAATPTTALVSLVRDRRPDVVALSASLPEHGSILADATRRLRGCGPPTPFIVVGGGALLSSGAGEPIEADAIVARADRAVEILGAWADAAPPTT